MPSLPAATTIVTPAAWTAQTARCIGSGSGVGRPLQPSGSSAGRGPRGSCSRPRWAGCPLAAWDRASRATQSSPQMIVASSPYPLAWNTRTDQSRAPGATPDRCRCRCRARPPCPPRASRGAIDAGRSSRSRRGRHRAVDAALDVQLVAADRPDAGVEDRRCPRRRPAPPVGAARTRRMPGGHDLARDPEAARRPDRCRPASSRPSSAACCGVSRAAKPDTAYEKRCAAGSRSRARAVRRARVRCARSAHPLAPRSRRRVDRRVRHRPRRA